MVAIAARARTAKTASLSLSDLAKETLEAAGPLGSSIVTAESCTAGRLASVLSEAPGAADHLHGGFVTYTKANKTKALGVPEVLLKRKGAVCGGVAIAMAEGALARSPANLAVAITGVAGPEPDEGGNPVGLVCIAVVRRGFEPRHFEKRYGNIGRGRIQQKAIADALTELRRIAEALDPFA